MTVHKTVKLKISGPGGSWTAAPSSSGIRLGYLHGLFDCRIYQTNSFTYSQAELLLPVTVHWTVWLNTESPSSAASSGGFRDSLDLGWDTCTFSSFDNLFKTSDFCGEVAVWVTVHGKVWLVVTRPTDSVRATGKPTS